MKHSCARLMLASWLSAPVLLIAAAPPPTDPSAPVPRPTYRSVFENYRPYLEERVENWRVLNKDVARAGGHVGIMSGARGHAHDAASPGTAAAQPVPPLSKQEPIRGATQAPAHGAHQPGAKR